MISGILFVGLVCGGVGCAVKEHAPRRSGGYETLETEADDPNAGNKAPNSAGLTPIASSRPGTLGLARIAATPLQIEVHEVSTGRLVTYSPRRSIDAIQISLTATNISTTKIISARPFTTGVSEDGTFLGAIPSGFNLKDDYDNLFELVQVSPMYGGGYLEEMTIVPGAAVKYALVFKGVVLLPVKSLKLRIESGALGNRGDIDVDIPVSR